MPRLLPPVVPPGSLRNRYQPTHTGAGITLRPFAHGDAGMVIEAYSDPDIQRWHFRTVETRAEAEGWIADSQPAWADERSATWAVVPDGTEQPAGRLTIYPDLRDGWAAVSYWVLPAARRQGLAAAAVEAVARWAFDDLGLHRLVLEHSVRNEASCRVGARTGFEVEGTLRRSLLHADGWHDVHLHARLAPDADRTAVNQL